LLLILVLTYSVVYLLSQNPNALEWEANIQNISIAIVVNITLLYPYGCLNKNGLQSLKELKQIIKKDFNVFIDKIRGEEYMNGNIIKSYKINNGKKLF
jgi:hypothetical protein